MGAADCGGDRMSDQKELWEAICEMKWVLLIALVLCIFSFYGELYIFKMKAEIVKEAIKS